MSKRKQASPVRMPVPPPRRGLMVALKGIAAEASTFQKIAGAAIAGISLATLLVTGISRYAPWAWASDVDRRQAATDSKVDLLTTVVLQSQIEDVEKRIADLEAKGRTKVGLTETEAEYLRAKKRRLGELNGQLKAITTPAKK